VSWVGVAEDVRVMGDFDGWTRGKELCADEISEHVISEFTGVLELLPVTTHHSMNLLIRFLG